MCRASIEIDGGTEDKTGFTMRLAAVVLPNLGTGPDTPIVVSHWFAARGDRVWEGERLVEVLVGPATFDVSSPASGRLAEIRGWEDDRVVAGAVLGLVAMADDDGASEEKRDRRRGQSGDEPPSSRPTT
jgi:pyruvate/2-oxoglutarate dehydrogenase complex dihydrolipoamide acyltransferase (E2) component